MKRLLLAVVAALVLLAGQIVPAQAQEEWCEADPLVVVTTPKGNTVSLFVTNAAAGPEHLPAVLLAQMSYTVTPADGGAATQVKLEVRVPDDVFAQGYPTRSTVSTGPLKTGTVYSVTTGVSNQVMTHDFKLNVG